MDKCEIRDEILQKANIGIWAIEMDEGFPPRLLADNCMKELLGVTGNVSPEDTYDIWFNNIHRDYLDTVNTGVEKMISGEHAEIQYPWFHPTKGMMYVRCGGVRDNSYTQGIRIEGSHQDITQIYKFHKDELTGLYTKEFFFRRVEEILADNPDTDYRLLVSDIENFKMINEKYGVEMGDRLLKYLAKAEKKIMPDNYILGARINADKFVCLQYARPQSREEGRRLAEEILKNSPVPNLNWKHGIYYTSFDRNISAQAMCDRARLAVDSIKGAYGVNCAVYDDRLRQNLLIQQQIVENMDEALERREFQVYLQPKHNLHTDKTGGAEALVRWIHPEIGFMNPGVFIPLFERNGFIKKLDRYVVDQVCSMIAQWKSEGRPIVPISVNMSRRDFEEAELADVFTAMVDKYGIEHEYIHIEITESIFSDNPEQTAEIVKNLHRKGFVIELDDFGTGYSSLFTLNELELDVLKLDMSLIQKDKPGTDRNVLNFSMQLAKMLNLESVAEGVETDEQRERIKELGCDYIQGYFYSKPLPISQFEVYLSQHI